MKTIEVPLPFDIKPEYLDSIIVFPIYCLLPCVELLPLVNVFPTSIASPCKVNKYGEIKYIERPAHMENGAMRRTTCCEFLGPFLRGIRSGSKSGGKYLLSTEYHISKEQRSTQERHIPFRSDILE
jgi:hypothetical protein